MASPVLISWWSRCKTACQGRCRQHHRGQFPQSRGGNVLGNDAPSKDGNGLTVSTPNHPGPLWGAHAEEGDGTSPVSAGQPPPSGEPAQGRRNPDRALRLHRQRWRRFGISAQLVITINGHTDAPPSVQTAGAAPTPCWSEGTPPAFRVSRSGCRLGLAGSGRAGPADGHPDAGAAQGLVGGLAGPPGHRQGHAGARL